VFTADILLSQIGASSLYLNIYIETKEHLEDLNASDQDDVARLKTELKKMA
jgi:hypothetical protein